MTLQSSEAVAGAEASSIQRHLIRTYLSRQRLRPVTHRPAARQGLVAVGRGSGPLDPVTGIALSRPLPGAPPVPTRLPAAVRSALEFIDAHAAEPIGLAEVAGAVGLSPRALQAAFRKHLDTTPLGYLRATRMARAHADLQAARPGDGQSVSIVANRWGFSQLSRFAHDYKERYGVSPRETLGRSGA